MPKVDPMQLAQQLITGLMKKSDNHFVLTWEGSKIPRGASIDGVAIAWTQHGIVTGEGGKQLGYYERIEEFGGASGQTQIMLIGTNGQTLTTPPGGTVAPLPKENAVATPNAPGFNFF